MADHPFDSYSDPRPSPPKTMIDQYLRAIRNPSAAASVSPSAIPGLDSAAPARVEQNIIEKIVEATAEARDAINAGRPTKPLQLKCIALVKRAMIPLVGKNGKLLATLSEWLAEISKTTLAPKEFIQRIGQVESLLWPFIESEVSGSILSASHPSHYPSAKKIFIGHGQSKLWHEVKDFIQDRLHLPWDEFNRVPVAGVTNIARLSEMLNQAAFAFLIMTAEDEQADGKFQARMNVVHEAGLFQGRLGFKRAIILLEEGCEEFSNVQGLGQIRFPKGHLIKAFEEIRLVLEREGLIPEK